MPLSPEALEQQEKEALQEWASTKYAVLEVDVSVAHTDEDLANIATHYPSGDPFSWDEFDGIMFIIDQQHPIDYELAYNDPDNDNDLIPARGTTVEHLGADEEPIKKIYITHTESSGTSVIIRLEGW